MNNCILFPRYGTTISWDILLQKWRSIMKRKCYESTWMEMEETRRDQILEELRKDTENFHKVIFDKGAIPHEMNVSDYYSIIVRKTTKEEYETLLDFIGKNGFIFAFMAYNLSKDDEIKKAALDLLDEIFSNHYRLVYTYLPKSKKFNGREIYEAYHALQSFDWINMLKSYGFTPDIDPEHASPFALEVAVDMCYIYTNHTMMEAVPVEERPLVYALSRSIDTVIGKNRIISRSASFMYPKSIDIDITDAEILKTYFGQGEIDKSKSYVTIRDNGMYDTMMIWLANREDIKEFFRIRRVITEKNH